MLTDKIKSNLASPAQLLDHRAVDWDHVTRARYWMEQKFEYSYPGPIRDLRQRLIVVPPDQYGDQQLLAYELHVSSPQATTTTELDAYGNRLIRTVVPYVEERVTFHMKMALERDFEGEHVQRISATEAMRYRQPTELTTPDAQIETQARALLEQFTGVLSADAALFDTDPLRALHQNEQGAGEAFAEMVNSWLYSTMRYGRGATTVDTTAADAFEIGQGLCQDYAHIMLAVCRAAGFAARYVSGHLLGEGRSHAWVELLLPDSPDSYRAVAFDPTNHRRTTSNYLTIAVGRDYRDVSPTSGTFSAPYSGHLDATKRAGITHIDPRF